MPYFVRVGELKPRDDIKPRRMMRPWMHDVVTKILQYRFMESQQVNGQVYISEEVVATIVPKEYLPC
jgi:hypothetical protein